MKKNEIKETIKNILLENKEKTIACEWSYCSVLAHKLAPHIHEIIKNNPQIELNGINNHFLKSYNNFLKDPYFKADDVFENGELWLQNLLSYLVAHFTVRNKNNSNDVIENLTNMLVDGNIYRVLHEKVPDYIVEIIGLDDLKCENTGNQLFIKFNDWQPDIEIMDKKTYKRIKIEDFKTDVIPEIVEMKVNFKTGNLLISDFFRFENDEFNEILDEKVPNIYNASILEKIQQTKKIYEKTGMIEIFVGNTITHTEFEDGVLSFSSEGNGPSVCQDRWTICVIEREDLENILDSHGYQGKRLVSDMIKEDGNINEIKITPGEYFVYYNPIYISSDNTNEKMGLCALKDKHFIISKEKLDLEYFKQEKSELKFS